MHKGGILPLYAFTKKKRRNAIEKNIVMLLILGFSAYSDIKDRTVPDLFSVLAVLSWWACGIINRDSIGVMLRGTAAAVLFYFVLIVCIVGIEAFTGNSGFGGADIKLLAVLFLYIGFDKTLYTIVIAGIIALVVVLSEKIFRC